MKIGFGEIILILAIIAVIVLGQGGIANVSETFRTNTGWKLDLSFMKQIFQPVIQIEPAPVTVQTQTDPNLLNLVEQMKQQNEALQERLDQLSDQGAVVEEAVKGALSGAMMAGSGSAQEQSVPMGKEPDEKSSKGFTLPNPFKLFGQIFK